MGYKTNKFASCFFLAIVCTNLALPAGRDEKGKKDAIERAVSELVKVKHVHTPVNAFEPDAHFWKVVLLGFDAVPSLIRHLDDRRLTQAEHGLMNNFPGYQLEVRHVASLILEALAAPALQRDFLQIQRGVVLRRSDVEAWWKEARAVGEERYLLHGFLQKRYPKDIWPNDIMLAIITRKYPGRLGEIYRKGLDRRPEMESWPLTKAIADSTLDKKTKQKLLLYGVNHKDLKHRSSALGQLVKLDSALFDKRVIVELNSLPKKVTHGFWELDETSLSYLVCQTKNPTVWKEFQRAAERCEVGLRMEFLAGMNCLEDSPTIKEQLTFLAHFLDDKSVRDVSTAPKRFTGPYAGGEFPRIEVRNYAAVCIAWCLEIEAHPSPEWNPNRWAKFRKQMRSELKTKGIPVAEERLPCRNRENSYLRAICGPFQNVFLQSDNRVTASICRCCSYWKLPPPENPRPFVPGKPRSALGPCRFLGDQTGERECPTCRGSVRLKVFSCMHPLHEETTLGECEVCADFEPCGPEDPGSFADQKIVAPTRPG